MTTYVVIINNSNTVFNNINDLDQYMISNNLITIAKKVAGSIVYIIAQ